MVKQNPEKKIFLVNRTINPVLGILDPKLINEVQQNPQNYRKLKADFISHNILDQGIFFTDHEKWKKQRQLIAHNFAHQEIKNFIPIFNKSAEKYVKRLQQQANGKSPISIITMCRKITSQVILGSFFGFDIDKKRVNDKPASQEVSDLMQDSILLNSQSVYMKIKRIILGETLQFAKFARCEREKKLFQRLNNLRDAIKQVIQIRIDKCKQTGKYENGDILDIYVKFYLEGNCDIEEIINQSITFFFVGQEPIGTTVALALYYIAKYKNVQNRLRLDMQNASQKLTKSQSVIISQDKQSNLNQNQQDQQQSSQNLQLLNLDYLQAILNETLRIQSPANMVVYRVAEKDHMLGGKFPVKKGWVLNTFFQAVNLNPKYYHNVDEFIPERWLGKEKEHLDKNIFTPFSGGPRNCLGQYFAQIEAKIIILHFMTNFKLILNDDVQLVMNQQWIYSPVKEDLIKLQQIKDKQQEDLPSLNLSKKQQSNKVKVL